MSRVNDALTRASGEQQTAPRADSVAVAPDFGALLDAEATAQLWPTERHDTSTLDHATGKPESSKGAPAAARYGAPAAAPQRPAPSGFGNLDRTTSAKLVLNAELDTSSIEQYRRLAARLHLDQVQRGTKLVMVTSALAGEGKTLTAANLALTLSESYRKRVLLVDGDLRRPGIHDMFGIPNFTGLSDAIRSTDDERKVTVIHLTEHLSVLTAGRPDSDPMGVLASERMHRVLADAAAAFDWVVIDTPPVALLSDAHLLASLVDTVVLVVRAGTTPFEAIQTATVAVGRDRIMGVVLNSADSSRRSSYRYYGRTKPETESLSLTH